jgi:cobalt/nickel transport system permease protein
LSDKGPVFYVLAGLIGAGLVVGVIWLLGRLAARAAADGEGPGVGAPPKPTVGEGQLPDWLKRPPPPCERVAEPPRTTYLNRTVRELLRTLADQMLAERSARLPGTFQSTDARVKLGVALTGLVVVASLRHAGSSALVCVALVPLASLSRLAVVPFLGRSAGLCALFALPVSVPLMLRAVTDGPVVVALGPSPWLRVTQPGALACLSLCTRVLGAVMITHLLALSTPWHELLAALRAYAAPPLLVSVLAMTYRYIAVLIQVADDAFAARRSRAVGRMPAGAARGLVGSAVGALFGRAVILAGDVHDAMLARGWTGRPRAIGARPLGRPDLLAGAAGVCGAILIVGLDQALG